MAMMSWRRVMRGRESRSLRKPAHHAIKLDDRHSVRTEHHGKDSGQIEAESLKLDQRADERVRDILVQRSGRQLHLNRVDVIGPAAKAPNDLQVESLGVGLQEDARLWYSRQKPVEKILEPFDPNTRHALKVELLAETLAAVCAGVEKRMERGTPEHAPVGRPAPRSECELEHLPGRIVRARSTEQGEVFLHRLER